MARPKGSGIVTAEKKAKQLYGAARYISGAEVYNGGEITDIRVRAFIDGARWMARQRRKNTSQTLSVTEGK